MVLAPIETVWTLEAATGTGQTDAHFVGVFKTFEAAARQAEEMASQSIDWHDLVEGSRNLRRYSSYSGDLKSYFYVVTEHRVIYEGLIKSHALSDIDEPKGESESVGSPNNPGLPPRADDPGKVG